MPFTEEESLRLATRYFSDELADVIEEFEAEVRQRGESEALSDIVPSMSAGQEIRVRLGIEGDINDERIVKITEHLQRIRSSNDNHNVLRAWQYLLVLLASEDGYHKSTPGRHGKIDKWIEWLRDHLTPAE